MISLLTPPLPCPCVFWDAPLPCRALAADSPFAVARENLVAHFEQNKASSQRLAAAAAGAGAASRGTRPASQALREMRVR